MSNVLITGANSGFGLLTARKFAEAGHTVHAGFRSKVRATDLDALALELPLVRPIQLDVTDQASIDAAVIEARTAGPIDVLVNNAGFEVASRLTLCLTRCCIVNSTPMYTVSSGWFARSRRKCVNAGTAPLSIFPRSSVG